MPCRWKNLLNFFLYAKAINERACASLSKRTGALATVTTVNDLAGVDLLRRVLPQRFIGGVQTRRRVLSGPLGPDRPPKPAAAARGLGEAVYAPLPRKCAGEAALRAPRAGRRGRALHRKWTGEFVGLHRGPARCVPQGASSLRPSEGGNRARICAVCVCVSRVRARGL